MTTRVTRDTRFAPHVRVYICENPYVVEGPALPLFQTADGDAIVFRLDVPGLKQENVRVWADDRGNVYFEGEDPKGDPEFDRESKRKFKGLLSLYAPFESFSAKIEEMKYVVKDGILKIRIPKK